MKLSFLLLASTAIILFSCNKDNSVAPTMLKGAWRMVLVKDNVTAATIAKPDSIQKNVDITFTPKDSSSGNFEGNTPTNTISASDYFISEKNILHIPILNMTKVNETPWGKEFVDNIRDANAYSFESDGRLDIITEKKTLVFQKM